MQGGSLDLKELKSALLKVQEAARAWKFAPDPSKERAILLNKEAARAEEAAEMCRSDMK